MPKNETAAAPANPCPPLDWEPQYSRWRHGGWYVSNVRYSSGACGCLSNNYIVSDLLTTPLSFFPGVTREIQRSSAGMFQGRSAS